MPSSAQRIVIAGRGVSARVLVVEDERIVSLDLCEALEENGYHVVGTETRGDRVVETAQRCRPDIVIMDVRLQDGTDGIEAAHAVRAALDLPVVFLTAQVDPETVLRIHELGAEGYLIKPVRDHQIGPVLRAALDRHRERLRVKERGDELWVTLQSIVDAVITVDPEGAITHLNPAAEVLWGRSSHATVGARTEDVLDLRDGRGGPKIDDPARQAWRDGRPIARRDGIWLHREGGPPCPVGVSASPIRGDDGRLLGAVLVLQDLSERERMRELLTRADRLASLGVMAASIAHEINNPLTYIQANLDLAVERLSATGEDPALVDALVDARTGAHAIEQIVRDLKLLSTHDRRSLEDVDMQAVVQRSLRTVAKEVRARGRLEASLEAAGPILADPVALGQIVWNLVLNAAQALPQDYDDRNVVRVWTGNRDGFAVLLVEDNGSGIPADILDQVYDPFFTTKPVGQGSGLGLAVTRQIIEGLGGQIRLDSEEGRGTSVEVWLPLRAQDTASDSSAPPSEEPTTWVARDVLVIDDDRLVRRAIQAMLSRVHTVTSASTVEEALALFRQGQRFDSILCDLMMSPHNGLEFFEQLAALNAEQASRTAFITGGVISGGLQEQVIRTQRPLAYKPLSREQLLRLVDELAQG